MLREQGGVEGLLETEHRDRRFERGAELEPDAGRLLERVELTLQRVGVADRAKVDDVLPLARSAATGIVQIGGERGEVHPADPTWSGSAW